MTGHARPEGALRAALLALTLLLPACPSALLDDDAGAEGDAGSDTAPLEVPDFLDADGGDDGVVTDADTDGGSDDLGPPCTLDSCNDGNPCTDDACGAAGCEHTPNAADCTDGLFCTGTDRCQAGTCSIHTGDPCPGTSTCTEELSTCDGCFSELDCPEEVEGPWSECLFTTSCASAGTQSRTVRAFTCEAGRCVSSDVPETQACTRASREGTSCGATSCGDWAACDWSGFCDEQAQQARSCIDQVCQSGLCEPVVRPEAMSCSRARQGQSCNAQTCDAWSGCDYAGECDESAQRSRTCYDHSCNAGSCGDSPFTVTEACSRSRDGEICGSNPSYCGTTTECHRCSNGNCNVNTPHYNSFCWPSCGEAGRLCAAAALMCCGAGDSCGTAGPGPWSDCARCCTSAVCF